MLDTKLLRNPNLIKDLIGKRNLEFPLQELLLLDSRRRELNLRVDEIRHKKNILINQISMKKKGDRDTLEEIKLMKETSNNLSNLEAEKSELDTKFKRLMMLLPNLILDSVPIGKNESDNVMVRSHGTIKKLNFQGKDHVNLSTTLDLVDFERAAKVAGARFYFLKNDLVLLNQALIRMALDFLSDKSYALLQPPY
ncbi:MAG: serine--tRNA ligase, partial [Nitrososphaeraceae archaeon]